MSVPHKLLHLHLVSDSTGETASSVARSVMSQFEHVDAEEHVWSLVRSKRQMERVIEAIAEHTGVVIYTIVEPQLQQQLEDACKQLKIPCVSVLDRVMHEISAYMGEEMRAKPGRQHVLDKEYFDRVDAINYTIQHDDGQATPGLEEADIILVGVSRTSKSPTCVYLAYRGLKAANVPYVPGCPLPENLFTLKEPLIVGLVISPERLIQIRKSRLVDLRENRETDYVDVSKVKDELLEARKLFVKQKWPIIDVTRKSVEETAATILQLYHNRKD